jgi:nucleoside-diphosphate-sugar epimerase
VDAVAEGGNGHLDPCPAQQVDRSNGLYFLKSFREDCENGGHRVSLGRMTANAHGNLSGRHLVVFGCGYVGGEVARQALQRGLKVTALTRNPATADRLRTAGVTAITADLGTDGWHSQVQGGADFVLNSVSSGRGGIDGYRLSYVEGMRSILAWAQRGPAGTFIYTGSTSVYPQGGGVAIDEEASTVGTGDTAQVLLEAERLLRNHAGAFARWFILRLAGIYGPGRHRLLDQVRAGEVSGRAQDHLNLIHRDDICSAIWAAFQAPAERKDEVFNVTDDGAATRGEIVGWLSARLGVPLPRFTEGPAAGRRATTPDRIIANAKLKQTLGWRPAFPSFREGYAAMLEPGIF